MAATIENGMISATDLTHLRRCVELAEQAVLAGDDPFGSVLVSANGAVLRQDRNRVVTNNNATSHPEIELVRWAQRNLAADERAVTTVYTSGEHCPMCSAAHGWAGLGRIVYASSAQQLAGWLRDIGMPPAAVAMLPIQQVVPGIAVDGPVPELAEQIRRLHERAHRS